MNLTRHIVICLLPVTQKPGGYVTGGRIQANASLKCSSYCIRVFGFPLSNPAHPVSSRRIPGIETNMAQ